MDNFKKEVNGKWFNQLLNSLNDGGVWIYPDIMEGFTKKGDKLVGSKRGVKAVKEITPESFHSKLTIGE